MGLKSSLGKFYCDSNSTIAASRSSGWSSSHQAKWSASSPGESGSGSESMKRFSIRLIAFCSEVSPCIAGITYLFTLWHPMLKAIVSPSLPVLSSLAMRGEAPERWRNLCEQAADEQDPEKLLEIIKDIIGILTEKADRLLKQREEKSHQGKLN